MTFLLWAKRENKPMNGCSDLTVDSSKPAYSDTWKRGRKGNDSAHGVIDGYRH